MPNANLIADYAIVRAAYFIVATTAKESLIPPKVCVFSPPVSKFYLRGKRFFSRLPVSLDITLQLTGSELSLCASFFLLLFCQQAMRNTIARQQAICKTIARLCAIRR